MTRVLVVGGGITGLAAALRLRELGGPDLDIVLADRDTRLGGKLRTGQIAGVPVELGAESFLVRRPEAARLAAKVGLGEAIVHPAPVAAALAVDGELRPVPKGTLLGVPADVEAVAATGVLSPAGEARMRDERPVHLDAPDASVGELVRAAFGDEVADRLVDPLLGGVYAGRADGLSVRATAPALAEAARAHDRLSEAVRATVRPGAAAGPVFGAVSGGMTMLVEATALAAGADLRLGLPVRELARTATGWRATLGPVPAPEYLDADAVLIAVPAKPASRLLAGVSPEASAAVGVLEYASMALVTMAFDPPVDLPELSGFLVPATEGRAVKAATFFSLKWPHRMDPLTILRCSMGRAGQEAEIQRSDAELIATARAELAELTGVDLPEPVDAHVTRWGGGLPQYAPGHDDRVATARAALASQPTLALAGAAFDGVGIPACVASGERAAEALFAALR
ncbi:protoporphyrinogen oxidase [Actinorhabdospora filicis]|uniref:Coproporphyrinogen III oxidase n=1 Tax=Actinorhabdospora filicis TaxID=1785913 RepID=A0A9W6SNG5_9ACTN|nr:protoporphyrinogen oxidase [Actinorhabdospora filicis]GLZ80129.1 protoporphyrinogen oxidase [Actinorhabdospora filicis]